MTDTFCDFCKMMYYRVRDKSKDELNDFYLEFNNYAEDDCYIIRANYFSAFTSLNKHLTIIDSCNNTLIIDIIKAILRELSVGNLPNGEFLVFDFKHDYSEANVDVVTNAFLENNMFVIPEYNNDDTLIGVAIMYNFLTIKDIDRFEDINIKFWQNYYEYEAKPIYFFNDTFRLFNYIHHTITCNPIANMFASYIHIAAMMRFFLINPRPAHYEFDVGIANIFDKGITESDLDTDTHLGSIKDLLMLANALSVFNIKYKIYLEKGCVHRIDFKVMYNNMEE